MFKRAALLALVLPFTLTQISCTDEQIAESTTIVGEVVITAAVVAAAASAHPEDNRPNFDPPDHRQPDHRPDDHQNRFSVAIKLPVQTLPSDLKKAQALTFKYGLSEMGSQKVVAAFAAAKKGSLTQFKSIGISSSDWLSIGNGRAPSIQAIDTLAKNLHSSTSSTEALMKDILKQVNTQHDQL